MPASNDRLADCATNRGSNGYHQRRSLPPAQYWAVVWIQAKASQAPRESAVVD